MSGKIRLEVAPLIKGFDGNFKTDEHLSFNYASHVSVKFYSYRDYNNERYLVASTRFDDLDDALNSVAAIMVANNISETKVQIADPMDKMSIHRQLDDVILNLKNEQKDQIVNYVATKFSETSINNSIPKFELTLN